MPTDSTHKPLIRVVPFSKDEYPAAPTSGPPLFTWREYYRFRNALLGVLRAYGTSGDGRTRCWTKLRAIMPVEKTHAQTWSDFVGRPLCCIESPGANGKRAA